MKTTMTTSTPAAGGNARDLLAAEHVRRPRHPRLSRIDGTLTCFAASVPQDRESSRIASSAGSGSEDDTYGGERGRTSAKKHRQKMQAIASGSGTPQLSEVRFSSRRAAKVTNYNEAEDDLGLSEEDTEATPNHYYVEDNTPAIDVVLNHRLKEDAGMFRHSHTSLPPLLIHSQSNQVILKNTTMSST